MKIPDHMNVQGKPIMDIKKGADKQPINTVADVANNAFAETKDTSSPDQVKLEPTLFEDRTRNIRFRVNEESKEMYVEVTNSDNEIVRTIPADENDPKFMSLINKSAPGTFIDQTG